MHQRLKWPKRSSSGSVRWGYGCGSLEVAADSAYCGLGQRGVEVIDMSSMR